MSAVAADRSLTDRADVIFRVLFSLIFVGAGLRHLIGSAEILARLEAAPLSHLATSVAPASLLVAVTGIVLVVAGLGLMLGVWLRAAAVALIVVLVPITVVVDLGHLGALGPLFKNIALLGGLIHFSAHGEAVRWSPG